MHRDSLTYNISICLAASASTTRMLNRTSLRASISNLIVQLFCIRITIGLLLEIHSSHVYHCVTVVGDFWGNILRHFTSSIHKSIVNCVIELNRLCTLMLDN